jgi:hypothetical protein
VSGSSSLHSRSGFAAIVAIVAIIAIVAGERTARAAASARLFYGKSSAVQGCADESELRRAIAQRVGYDPIFPMAPNSVAVSITRDGEQFVAEVKLANREGLLVGSRTLRAAAARCGELTDTIALTVAIALDTNDRLTPSDAPAGDPASTSPDGSSTPANASTPSGAAQPPGGSMVPPFVAPNATDKEAESPPSPVSPAPWPRLEIGAGVTAAWQISPAASLGAAGSVDLRWARFSLGVEGWLDAPASSAAIGIPGATVRTSFIGAGPTACLHAGGFFGCALAIAGSLHAEAPGVPGASTGRALDVLAGLRGGVALPLTGALSLRLSLDLLADPLRPAVRASGQQPWEAPLFAAASQLALAARIP